MAVDIAMKIGDIKGESMGKTHKDEVDVLNWSWGIFQTGDYFHRAKAVWFWELT